MYRRTLRIRDDLDMDRTAALDHAENRSLIDHAGTADLASAIPLVHVAGLTADVGLIDLNLTGELEEAARLHGETDSMEHEPRGLLSNPERATEFVRADAVLRVGCEPDSGKPFIEAERGILEDRPDLDRELSLAALALPEATSTQVGVLSAAAARARRAIRPAELRDVFDTNVAVGEVADSLDEVLGLVCRCAHTGESTTSPLVCQVYQPPC